jgi:hypothetical protein
MPPFPPPALALRCCYPTSCPTPQVPDGGVAGDNSHLNCLMPPARYATGRGVAAQLCGGPPPLRRRSIPHPDLVQRAATTGIGKAAPGLAASSQALGGQAAQPGGQKWASGWGGGGEAGEGGEAEDLMRRRSIMVGDLLNRLHQEHQEAEAGAYTNPRGMLPTIGDGGRVSADSIQGGRSQQLASQQHSGSAVARGSLLYSGGGSTAAGGGDMAVAHGGSSGEQGRAFSLARRSVTIAEVQHHQDVEKKVRRHRYCTMLQCKAAVAVGGTGGIRMEGCRLCGRVSVVWGCVCAGNQES